MSNRSKKDRKVAVCEDAHSPAAGQFFAAQFRASILPPPAEMEKYETLSPGITRELLETYKKQVDHRLSLESEVIHGDTKRANLGQIFSFILGMSCLLVGAGLFISNKDGFGIAAVITAIAPIITAFIAGSVMRRKERQDKKQ